MVSGFEPIAYEAVNNYFSALALLGYLNDKKVNLLLLLLFLDDFLANYKEYITEDNYNIINNIVSCLEGSSCLIPYDKYMLPTEPRKHYIYIEDTEED